MIDWLTKCGFSVLWNAIILMIKAFDTSGRVIAIYVSI